MRFFLIGLNLLFVLLLLPWMPVALWFVNFLNDDINRSLSFVELISAKNAIYLTVLCYPLFVIYSIVSGWYFFMKNARRAVILVNALSPLLPIHLLFTGILFFSIF